MMFDSEAYMSGAIPSGSWVPGQRNGASLSDRESSTGQTAASGGGLHVNPLIGRGAHDIHQGVMGMGGMMNPLMMGRMAAFGGGGAAAAVTGGMTGQTRARAMGGGGMGARTQSQPNLYIPPTQTRSQVSHRTLAPSQSPSQTHHHSLAHRQMSANSAPRSPLARSYVAQSRSNDDEGYFRPSHRSPLSPAARGSLQVQVQSQARDRISRSVPTTPVYDGWAKEASSRSVHGTPVAPSESSDRMSYDPPSSASGLSSARGQERAILRHERGRSRSRSQDRALAESGRITDPEDWESHSGAPRRISPEAVYSKLGSPIRDKADSLPEPQAPSARHYDDRRSRSQQPRSPTALRRSESSRFMSQVGHINSIPEGRQHAELQGQEAGDSVPLPQPRTLRPSVARRHTSQPARSPLPSAEVPMPSPSPLASARGRQSRIPRSMSHDTLDMYGLAEDLPPLSPLSPRSKVGGSHSPASAGDPSGARRTGYVAPLHEDDYDRYTAHPAAESPSSPMYAFRATDSASGSAYTESGRSRGRSPIIAPMQSQYGGSAQNAAQAMMPAASMSTMSASPQTPGDKPPMGSDYLTPGFPKPTKALAWNRDGPTMKSPGIGWHREAGADTPLSPAPTGPSWQQAAPPNYGPILPDRASSHGSGWWEAASRV